MRAREFLMKDLYTFDLTKAAALKTYQMVRDAYNEFFRELQLPDIYCVPAASGKMGGRLSHEWQLPSKKGEDEIVICKGCQQTTNIDLAKRYNEFLEKKRNDITEDTLQRLMDYGVDQDKEVQAFPYVTKERDLLIVAVLPMREGSQLTRVNPHWLKESFAIDTSIESPVSVFLDSVREFDECRLPGPRPRPSILFAFDKNVNPHPDLPKLDTVTIRGVQVVTDWQQLPVHLVKVAIGDICKHCKRARLNIIKCVELGHTFYLGTRYSEPLGATVRVSAGKYRKVSDTDEGTASQALEEHASNQSGQYRGSDQDNLDIPMEMGCHGIGITRLMAAVADSKRDSAGLIWPRAMSPFEVIIIPTYKQNDKVVEVYDALADGPDAIDCVIDDRKLSFAEKVKDAELIGVPIVVGIGKAWQVSKRCFVRCRQLEQIGPDQQLEVYGTDIELRHLRGRVLEMLDYL